ncbi:putative unusual protein kinase regulating ubiquinone biosynthesis (AarF/ABC1/UbiB family) [Bacillus ectoiniformans]|uniref:ABC1 kinase family protein n=1 Tax=Bacillus ectoiniformans TaxID=1494429 RepID=UPI00195B960C|nr:AarF/UbiB family protein [Bacillus ectoiniformans]MBM7648280.1 putative unusual protein kinase regulating ubiquinone biosynthesis (AarF/ABC1/UbiB family) [Bacillus ectoiniformans]
MKNISLYRIVIIVSMAVKFFIQVVYFQKRHKRNWNRQVNDRFEALLKRQASEYKRTALHLEGLLIKLGQFLSTRADIMPPVFIHELEDLIDRVPSVPWLEAKETLEEEWNSPYDQVVAEINEQPAASASIGQVHRAQLPNGDMIAIKIQRPGIERIILTDFKAVKIVMWLANRFTSFGKQTDLSSLYHEMTVVIGQELNFRKELQNGLYFKKRYQSTPGVDIPAYYEDYSTKRVLVMEWIEGARITDLNFLSKHKIDRHDLAKQLVSIFLEQLLQEGKFHADPHPGNILIQPNGTVILIDFGMVGEVNREDATYIRQLVEGIIVENYDQVLIALERLRFLLPSADKNQIKKVITTLIHTYTEQDLTAMDDYVVQQILEDIQRIVKKQPIQLPSEFAFLGRAVSTFVGILHILDPHIDLLEVGKPLVLKWINENSAEKGKSAGKQALQVFNQSIRPLLSLPRQIQQALDEPRQYREWIETKDRLALEQTYVLSKKRDAFYFMIISLIFGGIASLFEQSILLYGSGTLFIISFFYYLSTLRSHRRLLKKIR